MSSASISTGTLRAMAPVKAFVHHSNVAKTAAYARGEEPEQLDLRLLQCAAKHAERLDAQIVQARAIIKKSCPRLVAVVDAIDFALRDAKETREACDKAMAIAREKAASEQLDYIPSKAGKIAFFAGNGEPTTFWRWVAHRLTANRVFRTLSFGWMYSGVKGQGRQAWVRN